MASSDEHADAPIGMTMHAFDTEEGQQPVAVPSANLTVQRYVAPAALQALRGDQPDPRFAVGRAGELFLTYGITSDVDAGRIPTDGLVGTFVSTWAFDADRRPASAATVLSQPHVGIQVAYGTVPDPAWRSTIAAWYRDIHAADVLAVDGVIGAVRFVARDLDEPMAGEHLVVFLLDDVPEVAMARVRERVAGWRDVGRTPSPGRASKAVFNGPFLRFADR